MIKELSKRIDDVKHGLSKRIDDLRHALTVHSAVTWTILASILARFLPS